MKKPSTLDEALAVILEMFPNAILDEQGGEILILTGMTEGESGQLVEIEQD